MAGFGRVLSGFFFCSCPWNFTQNNGFLKVFPTPACNLLEAIWLQMVLKGTEWLQRLQLDPKSSNWLQEAPNCIRKTTVAQKGPNWFHKVQIGFKTPKLSSAKMLPKGTKWRQKPLRHPKRRQKAQNCFRKFRITLKSGSKGLELLLLLAHPSCFTHAQVRARQMIECSPY